MRLPLLPSILFLAVCATSPLVAAEGVAPPAPSLNYQGRLVEDGLPVSGARFFRFSILDGVGTQLWQSAEQSVTVVDGLYAIQLSGFAATVLAESGLALRVEVGEASGALTALTPNIALIPGLQATTAFSVSAGAVGTAGLVDGAVTAAKLAPGVIISGPTGPQGPAGAQGPIGAAGVAGVDGRTVLNGSGVPAAGLGANGDFYLDTAVSRLYGPKTTGAWGAGVALIGATGPAGAAGAQGSA
nr:hypothetical protein [Planctomycetota bacterium]